MPDTISLVRFLHPGREHDLATGLNWNGASHRRRYMQWAGEYMRECGSPPIRSEIQFWGEWESGGEPLVFQPNSGLGYPQFLFRPVFRPKPSNPQNTDPLVFDGFHYGWCRQSTRRRTLLQALAKGSIILFGSSVDRHFVLDTVFVVAHSLDYIPAEAASVPAPDLFRRTTLIPGPANADIAASDVRHALRLYTGATAATPLENGTFSFFPCIPAAESTGGFPRPSVRFDPTSTAPEPNQTQGYRHRELSGMVDARKTWEWLVSQVTAQGRCLGISAAAPGGS